MHWGNAVAELFFHTLNTQLIHHERFRDKNEASQALFNSIEAYYKRRRRHSSIEYKIPAELERNGKMTECGLTSYPPF